MAQQADISSIECLERFRAALIIFMIKARRSVAEVSDEVRRTRIWLQSDQKVHWEGKLRQRRKLLQQAEQEFFAARLSAMRESTSAQKMAVHRAKHAVEEAEEKLKSIKKWNRDFDGLVDPQLKRLEAMRQYLDYDLPKAITYLVEAQRILDAYSERGASAATNQTAELPPPLPQKEHE